MGIGGNIDNSTGGGATAANQLTVYAAGTAYSLTNAQAALNFGTTSPSLTINAAGTYLIFGYVQLDYNSATFAAVRNATLKLRRTNNTPADITGATLTAKTQIITTLSFTMGIYPIPPVIYTTTNTNDAIALFGGMDTAPTAGSLDAVAASIIAIRLQQ